MKQHTQKRLAKLEDARPGARPYMVVGADAAECQERLRKLRETGEIEKERPVILVFTGIAGSDEFMSMLASLVPDRLATARA